MTIADDLANITSVTSGRYGRITYFKSDKVIGASLREYGEWAQQEIDFLLQFLNEGDCVIDVGAFIGTHTLAFSGKVGKQGQVCAIEPDPCNFRVLTTNVERNGLTNVRLENMAASNARGVLYAPAACGDALDNPGAMSFVGGKTGASPDDPSQLVPVPLGPLDELNLTCCRLIKIDAEGMELQALQGSRRLLQDFRPLVYAECLSVANGAEILAFSREVHYAGFLHISPAYNPANFRENTTDIFGAARECGILLVPEEELARSRERTWEVQSLIPLVSLDDLVAGMLSKPQYKHEILAQTTAAPILGNDYWLNEPEREIIEQQVQALEERGSEQERAIQSLRDQLTDKEREYRTLRSQTADKDRTIRVLDQQLQEIRFSRAWKLVTRLGNMRTVLIPKGGRREIFAKKFFNWLLRMSKSLARGKTKQTRAEDLVRQLAGIVSEKPSSPSTISIEARSDAIPIRIPDQILSSLELQALLEQCLETREFVIAISHDNYLESTGGVQITISDEQSEHNARGISYLHIYPYNQKLTLVKEDEPFYLGINCDGKQIGASDGDQFMEVLGRLRSGKLINVFIHHTMGFSFSLLNRILAEAADHKARFWLHDNFSLCPSYYLLRNDLEYCHAPDPDSNACFICSYGDLRRRQMLAFSRLFQDNRLEVVAPSSFTLEFWKSKFPEPAAAEKVLPHAKLVWKDAIPVERSSDNLRIGYLGFPVYHKGWQTWLNLSRSSASDDRYRFFVFSSTPVQEGNFSRVSVDINRDDRFSMIAALREHRIDVAVLWSLCPETFSFTLHEALAAGCFIITNRDSGNIQDYIRKNPERGVILEDEQALEELFSGGEVLALVDKYQKQGRPQADILLLSE